MGIEWLRSARFLFYTPTLVVSLTSERNRNSRASSRPRPSGGFRESVRFVGLKRGGFTNGHGTHPLRMEGVLGWLGSVLLLSVLVSSSLFFSFRAHHELGAVHLSAEILVMATKAASFFFGGRIEVGYCPFRYLYCAVIGSDFLASFPSFHKTDDYTC